MSNQTKTLTEYSKVPFVNNFPTKRDVHLLRRTGDGVFNRRIVEWRARHLRSGGLRLRRLFLWHCYWGIITAAQNDGRVIATFCFGFSLQIGFAGLRIRSCDLPDGNAYHLMMTGDAYRSAGFFTTLR